MFEFSIIFHFHSAVSRGPNRNANHLARNDGIVSFTMTYGTNQFSIFPCVFGGNFKGWQGKANVIATTGYRHAVAKGNLKCSERARLMMYDFSPLPAYLVASFIKRTFLSNPGSGRAWIEFFQEKRIK